MKQKKHQISGVKSLIRGLEGITEIVILGLIYYYIWRQYYDPTDLFPTYYGKGKYILTGVYMLMTMVLFSAFDGFKFGYLRISEALMSQCIAVCMANFITFWQLCLIANVMITPVPMLIFTAICAVVCLICVVSFTQLYHRIYVPKRMCMIFGRETSIALKFKMETRPDKYNITKLIPLTDGLESILEQIPTYDAVILNDIPAQMRNDILKFCYRNEIRTYISPNISDILLRGATNINLFDTPLLLVKGNGLTSGQAFIKRAMDLCICVPVFLIALPFMLLVALAITLEDKGPVFFKQDRMSLDGKVFQILKFRSMIVDAEKYGHAIPATERDPRITKVGAFIRATRLDELPQLINIIKGDMSIVGPRPERVEHMLAYRELVPEFDFRTKVKGGLTGYAQIYGKYNTSPYDKLRLDMLYIENYSLILDIKLILMTLRIILTKSSTEGFDKAAELEVKTAELLQQMQREREDFPEEAIPGGK